MYHADTPYMTKLSAELLPLLSLCVPGANRSIAEEDAQNLMYLIQRHRLLPLIAKYSLSLLPASIQDKVKRRAVANQQQMLRLSAEMLRIDGVVSKANISALFIKGPVLAYMLYGDSTMRQSRDIDILVPPDKVMPCIRLLRTNGYICELTEKDIQRLMQGPYHTINLRHAQLNVTLELHWRFFANAAYIPFALQQPWSNVCTTQMEGHPIHVVEERQHILYLFMHGSLHAWSELAWLSDIRQLLLTRNDFFNSVFLLWLKEQNMELPVLLGIYLVHIIWGIEISDMLQEPINIHISKLKRLAHFCVKAIHSDQRETAVFRIRKIFFHMQLRKGIYYKIQCIISRLPRVLKLIDTIYHKKRRFFDVKRSKQ